MTRILLLLCAPAWREAEECIRSACDAARDEGRLSVGLLLEESPTAEELRVMASIRALQYLTPAFDPWQDMEALWQGETHVLLGHRAMRFSKNWDRALLDSLAYCQRTFSQRSVLTGYLPRQVDPVDAVYPVAARRFDRRGRLCMQRGTPLRYARHPIRSAFLHPDFCFGPAAFFRQMAGEKEPRFAPAYRLKWEIYTLNRPVIHMIWDQPLPDWDIRAAADETSLRRFESRFKIDFASRTLSPMARCGVFSPDLSFPTHVPLAVRVQEALRNLDNRGGKLQPMCVTAWLMIPGLALDEQRMTCFRRLKSMKHLPLTCFSDSSCIQRVRNSCPEALEYKGRYGLNAPVEAIRQGRLNYVRLCKPFILAQCREMLMSHSHYIWLDFDYLRYPAYERSALDWETVCGSRIVLAMVDGEPDTGMLVVPQEMLEMLCREITLRCQEAWKKQGCLPEEHELWLELMDEHPQWFVTHNFPGRRELLAITMAARGEEFHTRA